MFVAGKAKRGQDGVLRTYRLYECREDETLVTVEIPVLEAAA